jgi:hypothetical protein
VAVLRQQIQWIICHGNSTTVPRLRKFFPAVGVRQFVPIRDASLDGIIAHLTEMAGGNVHDHGVVIISSSRPWNQDLAWAAKNAVDLAKDSVFWSKQIDSDKGR